MSDVVDVAAMARAARAAARRLANVPTASKNAVLLALAEQLIEAKAEIAAASAADVEAARRAGLAPAKIARLQLTERGVEGLAEGVRQVAALADPVGQVTRLTIAPSGMIVRKTRAPLGVIAMIYEARPGVTVDAFALCFKAGNACILKGGKEAAQANELLGALIRRVLAKFGLPEAAMTAVVSSDRAVVLELLQQRESVDLVIPRGGEELIRWVAEHSKIPTIQHYKGVNHAFVHAEADLDLAREVCLSAKVAAPATCNALECVLVDRAVAHEFVPRMVEAFAGAGVEVRGCAETQRLAKVTPAGIGDFGTEFLDLIVAMKVVSGLDEAVSHIERFGSQHSEAIFTRDQATADAFLARVQASCVLHNASTRMNDGSALGLGAEIGISTSRLHAFGPMGLEDLTIERYVCVGSGQTR